MAMCKEWMKKVRPQNSWMQLVKIGMRKINNLEWVDREG